jgi:hypothetical protein
MKRSSALVVRLVTEVAINGVDERRIERWTANGLGPPSGAPEEGLVAHFSTLAGLSRRGVGSDTTAMRMAARGYTTARLRDALLRTLEVDGSVQDFAPVDLSANDIGDRNFAEIERAADFVLGSEVGLPPALGRVMQALRDNAARNAAGLGETPDEVIKSFFVNVACFALGDDIYNPSALAAVLDTDPDDFSLDVVDLINQSKRITPQHVVHTIRVAPLREIVEAASTLARVLPQLLSSLGVTDLPIDHLEILSTIAAPFVCAQLRNLNAAIIIREEFDAANVPRQVIHVHAAG